MTEPYETVIVGAGPAGLTAALTLARYRHPCIVVDSPRRPRNGAAAGVHGYLGLDDVSPEEVRVRAWRELTRYRTVHRREADIVGVQAVGEGRFRLTMQDGEAIEASSVLLATGVRDIHPSGVPGFTDCWGRSVIHCPFCLGEENAGGRWAVVADNAQLASLTAVAFRAWSDNTVAICPPSMPGIEEAATSTAAMGGELVAGTIRRLHHRDGALRAVEFDDGRVLERDTLVWTPSQRQHDVIDRTVVEFGLPRDDAGFLTVDATQSTKVPGLFAAGDVASRWSQSFTAAAAAGAVAAEAIHAAAVMGALRR